MAVRVQAAAFDPGAELSAFTAQAVGAGAVVTFTGLVRDGGGALTAMEIEHWPGATERAIERLVEQATARWALTAALVIHRHGMLRPNAPIMMVATAAPHRAAAFEAADFLMDYLKSGAPFWKREITENGSTWVAARDLDKAALRRW